MGIYVNRDLKEKWGRVRGWMKNREEGIRTIIGEILCKNRRIREKTEKRGKRRRIRGAGNQKMRKLGGKIVGR